MASTESKLLLVLCVLSRITKGEGLKEEKSFMSGSNSKMLKTVLEVVSETCVNVHACVYLVLLIIFCKSLSFMLEKVICL